MDFIFLYFIIKFTIANSRVLDVSDFGINSIGNILTE
jgi:hypothetical protein